MKLRGKRPRALTERDLDLDVVRGLAILLAMGWHYNTPTGWRVLDAIQAPGRTFGWAGVDLFFVLSGFLVGRIALREIRRSGRFESRRFMIRRILKLWPVLYLYLFVQLIAQEHPWDTFLFQNLIHVQNFTGSSLAQMWSLAVEEHFYLAVGLLLPLWATRSTNPRLLVRGLVAVMIAAPVLRAVAVAAGASVDSVHQQSQYRIDAMAAGVLLAATFVYYPQMWANLLRLRILWLFGTATGVTWLCLVDHYSRAGQIAGYTVAYLTGACLILAVRQSPLISRAAPALRPFGLMGFYSYGLYIWHPTVANAVSRANFLVDHPAILLMAKYGAATTLAIVVTHLVELPFLALRDRLYPPRSDTPRPTGPTTIDLAATENSQITS